MDLHFEIMNLNPEKRKQNLAIDEAIKNHKSLHEIMVAVYARAFRDAKHAAAEKAAQQGLHLTGGTLPPSEPLSDPKPGTGVEYLSHQPTSK